MSSPSPQSLKAKSVKKQSIIFLEFVPSDLPPQPQDLLSSSLEVNNITPEPEFTQVYSSYVQFISSTQFKPTIQKRYKLQFKHPSKRVVAFKITSSGLLFIILNTQ